jgi:hypothetical protein
MGGWQVRHHGKASLVRSTVSGAEKSALRRTLLVFALAGIGLLSFVSLSQAKVVVNGFGTSVPATPTGAGQAPAAGGEFRTPAGIAVNNSGAGGVAPGTSYIVDSSANRVQRFSPSGAFERVWGQNVLGRNERQFIVIDSGREGPLGGSFSLSFGGETVSFAVVPDQVEIAPTPEEVQSGLEGLASIGAGNVEVEGDLSTNGSHTKTGRGGGSFLVRFIGALAGTNVPQLTIDASELTGTAPLSASVSTLENGAGGAFAGFEICTVASECKDGETSGETENGGQLSEPMGVAVNQGNGHVYVTENFNYRVSEFDADGNFVRAWGGGVATGVETFEICVGEANCNTGVYGGNGGQFEELGNPVTDSSNNVWVPDPYGSRVQKFDSSGNFIAAYGYDVDALGGGGELESCTSALEGACQYGTEGSDLGQFSSGPSQLAFDSAGNIYAIDPGNSRVQKFDSAFTSAVDFGAATFEAFTEGFSAPEQVTSTQGGARLVFAIRNFVTGGGERQLLEIDPADASVKDTSLVDAGLDDIGGLAEQAATGNLLATTSSEKSPRKVLVLSSTPLADPAPVMNPVTVKTDTTATFSGTVDPKGGWVSCAFEYSTDQVNWNTINEPECDSLSPAGGAQAVSQTATGLTPGRHYFVRLSASRPLAANSTKTSFSKAFDTDGAAPTVTKVGFTALGDRSVRLLATIDPRNSDTGYVFEYGTTPSTDSSTASVNIGGGTTPLLVSQVVGGLEPGTHYYFRVVATNLVGATASPGQSFTTRLIPVEPSNRKYELVSPPDKNFGGVDFAPLFKAATAPDGEAADFCTASGLPTDPPGQVTGACSNYISRRAASGWETNAMNPYACSVFSVEGMQSMPTLNLDYALVGVPMQSEFCSIPTLAPGAPSTGEGFALYRENLLADPFSFKSLAPLSTGVQMVISGNRPSTSDDASHVVYPSDARQTTDAPAGVEKMLFDWHEDSISLVSRDTAGQPFMTSSNVPVDSMNGISASGDRIFFQNPVATGFSASVCLDACEIYMRENAAVTHWVSEQECSPACPDDSAKDLFLKASLDGSKAFFRSKAKLVDADSQAGFDLYRYANSANPAIDKNLTLVSKDHEPADGNAAEVEGVLGASDEGDVVYYVASGQIIAGEPTAGGPKVYRWRWNGGSPTTDYLATLVQKGSDFSGGGDHLWFGEGERPLVRLVTSDGKYLLVQTVVQLDPVVDRDSDSDVYRWGAAEGWTCASCQDPGAPSAGRATFNGTDPSGINGIAGLGMANQELRIVMSDDGERIFFTAKDALVPADSNGAKEDVYEWHDGDLSMISNGLDTKDVVLIGASSSGRDVFFITYEKFVGWDTDANTDVYDARVGGGFPEPPPRPPICQSTDECRGPFTSPPPATGAGTPQFQGPGNPQKKPCAKGKVRRHGKCVKKAAKKRARHARRRAGR